ncbi:MAG: hypothetical protein QGH02_08110, partial [Verrucomicrobiota bacterium]|nr:hypothetical protein [Verrucomicrobiota bacterium]
AQQGLLVAALADAAMLAGALAACEAHGTGTALGDPIEAGSLAAAVLAACRATPTLRLVVVVHDARERQHALVAFAARERARGRVVAEK